MLAVFVSRKADAISGRVFEIEFGGSRSALLVLLGQYDRTRGEAGPRKKDKRGNVYVRHDWLLLRYASGLAEQLALEVLYEIRDLLKALGNLAPTEQASKPGHAC